MAYGPGNMAPFAKVAIVQRTEMRAKIQRVRCYTSNVGRVIQVFYEQYLRLHRVLQPVYFRL